MPLHATLDLFLRMAMEAFVDDASSTSAKGGGKHSGGESNEDLPHHGTSLERIVDGLEWKGRQAGGGEEESVHGEGGCCRLFHQRDRKPWMKHRRPHMLAVRWPSCNRS